MCRGRLLQVPAASRRFCLWHGEGQALQLEVLSSRCPVRRGQPGGGDSWDPLLNPQGWQRRGPLRGIAAWSPGSVCSPVVGAGAQVPLAGKALGSLRLCPGVHYLNGNQPAIHTPLPGHAVIGCPGLWAGLSGAGARSVWRLVQAAAQLL